MKTLSSLLLLSALLLPTTTEARVSARDAKASGEANKQETMQRHIDNAKNAVSNVIDVPLITHKVGEAGLQFSVPKDWNKSKPHKNGTFSYDAIRGNRSLSTLFIPSSLDRENLEYTSMYFEKRELASPAMEPRETWYFIWASEASDSMNPGTLLTSEDVTISGHAAKIETYTTGSDSKQYVVILVHIPVEIRGEYLLYLVASNYSYKQYEPIFAEILASVKFVEETSNSSSSVSSIASDSDESFTDIPRSHPYQSAIAWGKANSILKGYPDGSFGPEKTIARAELLKIIVEAMGVDTASYTDATGFADVDESAWYAPYVRYAKAVGIIQGYEDNTFRPGNSVNAAEAMKMIYKTLQVDTDDTGGEWYERFFTHARNRSVLFSNDVEPGKNITRKDVMWIVWKLRTMNSDATQSSSSAAAVDEQKDKNWAYYQGLYDELHGYFESVQEDLSAAEEGYLDVFANYGFDAESSRVQPYMQTLVRATEMKNQLQKDRDWLQQKAAEAKNSGVSQADKQKAIALNEKYYAFSVEFYQFITLMELHDTAAFERDYFMEEQYYTIQNKAPADVAVANLNLELEALQKKAESALLKVIATPSWPNYLLDIEKRLRVYLDQL